MEFFVGKRFIEEEVWQMLRQLHYVNAEPNRKLNKKDTYTLERMLRDLVEYKQLEKKCECPIDLRCIMGQGMGVYILQKGTDKLQLAEVMIVYEHGFKVRWFVDNEEHSRELKFNQYKKFWWTNSNKME